MDWALIECRTDVHVWITVIPASDGTVRVLDFGLGKAMQPREGSPHGAYGDPSPTSLTLSTHVAQAGIIPGTAAYMAPEQARGKTVDTRADIWAFGGVLFEMLSGTQPFPGEDISRVRARVTKQAWTWRQLALE
jgi:serine/threonine-protein kinase